MKLIAIARPLYPERRAQPPVPSTMLSEFFEALGSFSGDVLNLECMNFELVQVRIDPNPRGSELLQKSHCLEL